MNTDVIKHVEGLTKSLEGDTAALRTLAKTQKLLIAACCLLLPTAVVLKSMGALSSVVISLALLASACGFGAALVGRRFASTQKKAEARREDLMRIIQAAEQHERAPRTPLAIGFANLSGPDLDDLAAQDAQTLGPLFMRARVAQHRQIPSAEVLFVYAHLNEDGTLQGPKPTGIRQIVQATDAAIVVLASPNSPQSIQNAVGLPGPKSANLVFTLDRNGSGFGRFFKELFENMQGGQDMLSAWVAIAPQHPDANPAYAPSTMLVAEGGKIAFPRA